MTFYFIGTDAAEIKLTPYFYLEKEKDEAVTEAENLGCGVFKVEVEEVV